MLEIASYTRGHMNIYIERIYEMKEERKYEVRKMLYSKTTTT